MGGRVVWTSTGCIFARRGRRRAVVSRTTLNLPNVVPGGSPHNPMGVAAMSIAGGEYAIHGTNQPGSVGHFVSYGCIRMFNEDITDLFWPGAHVGTRVVVQ